MSVLCQQKKDSEGKKRKLVQRVQSFFLSLNLALKKYTWSTVVK